MLAIPLSLHAQTATNSFLDSPQVQADILNANQMLESSKLALLNTNNTASLSNLPTAPAPQEQQAITQNQNIWTPAEQAELRAKGIDPRYATPPSALGNVPAATPDAGGNSSPAPANSIAAELQARAEAIFGRATKLVHLDSDQPLGYFLDQVRDPATPCPDPELAVRCGGGLCAIVIDSADVTIARQLVTANPWALDPGTVWAAWRRAYFIFLRVTGDYPPSCSFPGGQWISDGLVPVVEVKAETTAQSFPIKGTSIFSLPFDDINWPPPVAEIFLLQRIEAVHGSLFQKEDRGQIYFGIETTARFFAELLGLIYRRDNTFSMHGKEMTEPIPKSKLANFISQWIEQQAEGVGIPCPTDARVPAVIDRLKVICATDHVDEAEGLQLYVCERLERKAGVTLTAKELFIDYCAFVQARDAVRYPEQVFLQRIAVALREQFGVCRSHSVRRLNPNGGLSFRTGYRSLAFKK